MLAPNAFRQTLERAITADDYATIAERDPNLERANARLEWTGSWYEADVAVDPFGSETPTDALLDEVDHELEPYRRILHDLRVQPAIYVPIDLRIEACALPGYRRADIKAALLASFGTGRLPNGALGFFNPDALSFGDGIYLSQIVARAQAIPGVECVTVTRLQRLYESANQEIENGVLPLATWEIPELDNDPNRPEHGRLQIVVQGGH
jgi:predicted phage baseplate assembly protein